MKGNLQRSPELKRHMKTGCRYKAENYRKKRVRVLVGGGAVPSALCFPSGACSLDTVAPQRWSPLGEGAALRFQGVSVRVRCPFSLSSIPGFVSPALCGGACISALPCLWCLTLDRSVVGGHFSPPPCNPQGQPQRLPPGSRSCRGGPSSDQWVPGLRSHSSPMSSQPEGGAPAVGCGVASPPVWLLSSHHLCS